ncbi:MAG TPA: hypothetical protein DCL98_05775 [Flavobacteriales bacterium]|nr:hypothetical protein [Flavobacteriales bacterium]
MINSDSTTRFVRGALLKGFGFAMGLTLGTAALAQQDWRTDALVQRLPNGQAYLEVQTAWESDLAASGDSVTLTVVVSRQDDVLGFRKSRLEVRPNVPDSSELLHLHVDRIPVPDGPCAVEWSVVREGVTLLSSNLTYRITPGGMPEIADPMVVATHAKASDVSDLNMVHSGMDLIPAVGKYISQDQAAAKVYVELHKMDDVVGPDSLFLLAYGWADAQGNWDVAFTKYKRLKAQAVVPVFESLPTSNTVPDVQRPVLKLEARTKQGDVIVSRDVVLAPRRDPSRLQAVEAGPASLLPSLDAFVELGDLVRHMHDHLALATTNEQSTILNVLVPDGDMARMKSYVSGFWLERSRSLAEADARHRQFMGRVAYVNEMYGDCKQGQGSMTEMGNIYIRFGKPNTVVKRHHETEYYPYEIWHYHKAGRFNNKRFLFFAPHVVSECFELLHSDMLGERQNEDWLSQLKSRENRLRVSESMENRLNPRDAFSREEPEDLFYNPR